MAPPNPLSVVAWRGVRLPALALFAAVAALAGVEGTLEEYPGAVIARALEQLDFVENGL